MNKWIKWLDIIRKETTALFYFSKIFSKTKDVYLENKVYQRDFWTFYEFIVNGYLGIVVMGIRRQVKRQIESVSIVRLLDEIKINPEILSRDYFLNFYNSENRKRIGNQVFDNYFGINSNHADPKIVQDEINHLKNVCQLVERYADKKLAHTEIGATVSPPPFAEVGKAIDAVEKTIIKYYSLLKGTSIVTVAPWFDPRWENIFKFPWIYKPLAKRSTQL